MEQLLRLQIVLSKFIACCFLVLCEQCVKTLMLLQPKFSQLNKNILTTHSVQGIDVSILTPYRENRERCKVIRHKRGTKEKLVLQHLEKESNP